MVYNYKVIIHFDGTEYYGWQFQTPEIKTVQRELINALKIIAKKKVVVTGSSRTDAGVHSLGLTANFHIKIKIEASSLKRALNALLPGDIRIMDCQHMDKSFNARYHASRKTYTYKIFFGQVQSPFNCRYSVHIPYPLNLKAMRKSLKYFRGEKNFSSFTSDEPNKKRIREISKFTMKVKGETIIFSVTGKSFLRYMVRNIIGTIIDVGREKINPEDVPAIFEAKDRRKAGQTAPAKGLTLEKVEY
ncbi:MAG: tRNA pseudouridine(38-40) synthase TruA [Candidatus Aminicenantes bacterium]|nr:tRNA pseudouridine(38-40) synthase TruA [Candidatus Aminicenantes bacterium]